MNPAMPIKLGVCVCVRERERDRERARERESERESERGGESERAREIATCNGAGYDEKFGEPAELLVDRQPVLSHRGRVSTSCTKASGGNGHCPRGRNGGPPGRSAAAAARAACQHRASFRERECVCV